MSRKIKLKPLYKKDHVLLKLPKSTIEKLGDGDLYYIVINNTLQVFAAEPTIPTVTLDLGSYESQD